MPSTRERIVDAGAQLFARKGYAATGMKQIVTEAQAPFGSVYHFFPGGKEQLAAETIRQAGARYGQLLPAIFDPAPDVVTATRDFFAGAAAHLRATDYADACPIATVALEVSSTSEPLRQACADVFEDWITSATGQLVDAGIQPQPARDLAIGLIAALEGAFVLARVLRSTHPLDVAGAITADAVRAALSD